MPRTSDEALIDALLRDEPDACKSYTNAYGDKLFRFIVARTKNLADAEDIHNDVLARTLKTWRPAGGPLKAWLYRLASQGIVAWARRTTRTRAELSLDQLAEEDLEPRTEMSKDVSEDRLATHRTKLREFVQTLSLGERQLFQLCVLEDLTDDQVADLTGNKTNSVKTMRLRMVRKIRGALSVSQTSHT